jgi:hypothetical protein
MILTNETDSNLQKLITLSILIGKKESRLVGKILKNSTAY